MDHQAAQGFGSKSWILGLEPSCQSGSSRCRGAGFASPSQGLIWLILIRREQHSVIVCAREERIVVQYMIAAFHDAVRLVGVVLFPRLSCPRRRAYVANGGNAFPRSNVRRFWNAFVITFI